uniref:Uncharacterized protein n=1 Tax=Helianthus annuus TaxID=4232 RepID=A0A251SYX8_HELAN
MVPVRVTIQWLGLKFGFVTDPISVRVYNRFRFRFGSCTNWVRFDVPVKQSTVGSNLVKAGQPSSRCSRVTGSGHRVKHET